jgi:signal recognition particle subunit SRP54
MINSMTKEERKNPEILSGSPSRRKRVAQGSGHSLNDVSKLVSDFQRMRTMMQQMGSGQMPGMGMPGMGGMGNPFGGGGGMPGMGGGGPRPGWRGYPGGGTAGKKKKKDKKKKGFGSL